MNSKSRFASSLPIVISPTALALALALVAVAGCGSTPVCDPGTCTSESSSSSSSTGGGVGGGGGAGGGAGGADACKLEAPGAAFTFHVHNGGTKTLRLLYGCGNKIPIDLETPNGNLNIGPLNLCEFTCDELYSPHPESNCGDCAGGVGAALAPGATVDLAWDHRVFSEIAADQACIVNFLPKPDTCALGAVLTPSSAQKGVLTVCTDPLNNDAGFCSSAGLTPVSFTIDTTKAEGTIEVQ
jgi:hypothetical protein